MGFETLFCLLVRNFDICTPKCYIVSSYLECDGPKSSFVFRTLLPVVEACLLCRTSHDDSRHGFRKREENSSSSVRLRTGSLV